MWMRYSKWILSSSKSRSSNYLQLIQQFRTQISRDPLKVKPRRSIKNFDETNVLPVEPHPIRLLIRPTLFTVGVSQSLINFFPKSFFFQVCRVFICHMCYLAIRSSEKEITESKRTLAIERKF